MSFIKVVKSNPLASVFANVDLTFPGGTCHIHDNSFLDQKTVKKGVRLINQTKS